MSAEEITAFRDLPERLGQGLRSRVGKNLPSEFNRKIRRCNSSCGMCCYDGGFVEPVEEEVLTRLISDEIEWLVQRVSIPDEPFVDTRWPNAGRQTAIVPHSYPNSDEFPPYFDTQSACVFLDSRELCVLEELAERHGRHRWFYKISSCWMFPIVGSHDGVFMFRLFSEETDPYKREEYGGFISGASCSKTEAFFGVPAREALEEEIDYCRALLTDDPVGARLLEQAIEVRSRG